VGGRQYTDDAWDDDGRGHDRDPRAAYSDNRDDSEYAESDDYGDAGPGGPYEGDDERGLVLRTDESLVGVSSIVTQHGTPILSYTRTMNRFYTSRKQRLSLGRHKCEVCGDRIRFWSFETPTGSHTHDGCYERLAWTWTTLYAQQQRLASEGLLE
jgi:hypothetical protein